MAAVLPVLGTAVLSPALDSLIEPFGTSPANIGLMVSFFTAPAILIIPLAGILADRYGRKPILVFSLLIFGSAGAAIAATTDFRIALALRLLQGVGFGGINPIIITSIGDIYSGTEEATGQGLRFTVSGLSATVFPPIAGLLVIIAWQYPFMLYIIALPVALVVHFWMDEPAENPHPVESDSEEEERKSYTRSLVGLLRQPQVISMVIARSLPVVIWIGFLTYNSLIVVRIMGGTPLQAGLLVAVGSLVFAITASQVGRITSMLDSRLYTLIGANICMSLGFGTVLFAHHFLIAITGIIVFGMGFGILMSMYRSIITELAPESLRGGLVSLSETGGRVASTVTPVLMGLIIGITTPTIGFAPAIQLTGVIAAIFAGGGGILCLLIASRSQ